MVFFKLIFTKNGFFPAFSQKTAKVLFLHLMAQPKSSMGNGQFVWSMGVDPLPLSAHVWFRYLFLAVKIDVKV